jgi:hypothetical protein
MQFKSSPAVGMHVNKARHNNRLAGVQHPARRGISFSKPLNMRPIDGNLTLCQIHIRID